MFHVCNVEKTEDDTGEHLMNIIVDVQENDMYFFFCIYQKVDGYINVIVVYNNNRWNFHDDPYIHNNRGQILDACSYVNNALS